MRFIPLLIVVSFGVRFVYIIGLLRSIGDNQPPLKLAENYSPIFSFIGWGLFLLGASYWGIVGNPYRLQNPNHWLTDADDSSVVLIIALFVAIIASFWAMFRYAEWLAKARQRAQRVLENSWHLEELAKRDATIARLEATLDKTFFDPLVLPNRHRKQ